MASDLARLFEDAAARYTLPTDYLRRTAQIESGLRPDARNPGSSAGGLFQFIDSTANRYGLMNKFDPIASTDAAARLARDNASVLRNALGRDPSSAELYLAHQQGAGGASRLLTNPDAPASSIVGERAVTLNGGAPNMSAMDFAGKWLTKFNGGMQPGTAVPMMAQAGAPQPTTPGFQMDATPAAPPVVSPLAGMFAAQQADAEQKKQQEAAQAADMQRRAALFGGPSPFG